MNSNYGQCSLFLHPVQHDFTVREPSSLLSELKNINFISQTIENSSGFDYFTGDKFLDYVAYMGCAPAIQFEANTAGENFCHIKIQQFDSVKLIHSRIQARAPHCPHCGKPVKNWQQNRNETTILCELCATTSNIAEFNWRKMAGYARLFIEITDIFPKEATPQQSLLDKLSAITEVEWVYFYSCS